MLMISLSVTLLVMLASLYFLAKVKSDNLGSLAKWTTYLVLIVATGMMICQLARGGSKMWHRTQCSGAECSTGMHHGQKKMKAMHCGTGMGSCCCAEMDCAAQCEMGGMGDCCKGGMKGMKGMQGCGKGNMGMKCCMMSGDPEVIRESSVDTVDGKIIKKETEIIKTKE